jgi:hypothetical protein
MRKSLFGILVTIILLSSSLFVHAISVDDEGALNDPNENGRANACYVGGSMEGQCLTEWDWEGGWYLIRFEFGLISRENFPAQFAILLPQEIVETPEVVVEEPSVINCLGPVYSVFFFNFGSSNKIVSPQGYSDPACSVPYTTITSTFVYTTAGSADALAICGFPWGNANSVGPNIYACSL